MRTLGEVADTNPLKCVLYLNDILAKMIPSLGAVKKGSDRKEFTTTFGFLCEAVVHAKSELEDVVTERSLEHKFFVLRKPSKQMSSSDNSPFVSTLFLRSGNQVLTFVAYFLSF